MIITVFGATGQVGKRVVRYGLALGHTVRAFSRDISQFIDEESRNGKFHAIPGHLFDKTDVLNAIRDADAVVSVLGGAIDGIDRTRSLGIKNIIEQMQASNVKRIIALGGYGVLSDKRNDFLVNEESYPEKYKAVGLEHLQAYLYLKQSHLDYTFICSPFIKEEESKGEFYTAPEAPPEPNHFFVTTADLGRFIVLELQQNRFLKQRVGISS